LLFVRILSAPGDTPATPAVALEGISDDNPVVTDTCWTRIRAAADGEPDGRESFARMYLPAVEAYLRARWRGTPRLDDVDDAVQEVFLDCFRDGGALERVDPERPGGFRAFLYGVVRYVALRFEEGRGMGRERPAGSDLEAEADEESLSVVFDRTWALSRLREAAELHAERAREAGEDATRRVELLRLRFEESLPIREIARRWDANPAKLHHDYARARREYKAALLDVVAFHHPGPPAAVEDEAAGLLEHFS
jgi:RNA polymerase sigma-70 factor (ECF subfamily)